MSSSEDEPYSSPIRRRSGTGTPETPRKRQRVHAPGPDTASLRKHDAFRKRQTEANYNDDYRILFNQEVAHVKSRFHAGGAIAHYTKQVGSVIWTPNEQAVFFAALERLGKDDLPGIASAVGTKNASEARDLLITLRDAATTKRGDPKVTLRDIPAAIELGHACDQKLEDASDALAWYQERFEAEQEQQRYGDYWLMTPAIAEEIEEAMSGVGSRPPSVPRKREPSRFGNGVAGACAVCKRAKRKCDRGIPCSRCAKTGVQCVYPKNPPALIKPELATEDAVNMHKDSDLPLSEESDAPILRAIPEARLLNLEAMLTLSRTLFMNRSDDIPSPWLHWSHYVSELASEPSMYRTAFGDFHRLVVSVTQRLVYAAHFQATSRMRSQRSRIEKASRPLVKARDVFTALDVLGMERNGSKRWRGVPRRCNLQVTALTWTPQGRRNRHVPWSEVEGALKPPGLAHQQSDSSGEPSSFKSRAMRSGTPLPMQDLTLSDDGREVVEEDLMDADDNESLEHYTDAESPLPARPTWQPRDATGRYVALPLEAPVEGTSQQSLLSLEEFDREATRCEERAIFDMLGEPWTHEKKKSKAKDDVASKDALVVEEHDDRVATVSEDWRACLEYRAPWEQYQLPVSMASFVENQKSPSPPPAYASAGPASPRSGAAAVRRNSTAEIDLRVRGTNAYAALQRKGLHHHGSGESDNDDRLSDDTSVTLDQDVPTQSIEACPDDESSLGECADEMDWS
ncbi:hypothetical protein ACEQ8H_005926 [Pleosporales sp. CAS-2024a]